MVQFERVGDGDLEFGVVILGLAVQVDPDASHCKGVGRLGLVDVWYRDTLETHIHTLGHLDTFLTSTHP